MANAEDRLSAGGRSCWCYALPAIPLAALALPLYVIVPTFYAQNLGLPIAAVGTVLLLIRLLDAASDPLIGWLCDRLFLKSGRRRTFFPAVRAIDGSLGIHGLLAAVGRGYRLSRLLGYAAFGRLYRHAVALHGLGAELSTDYRGRSVVSAFREGATLIGTLIAVVLPFAVGLDDTDGFHGLAAVAVLTIVLLPAAGLLAVKTVPEPVNRSTTRLSFADSLRFVIAQQALRPARRRVPAQRLCQRDPGDAVSLFRLRTARRCRTSRSAAFSLFPVRDARRAFGRLGRRKSRQAPHMVRGDDRRLRGVRLCRFPWLRRHRAFRASSARRQECCWASISPCRRPSRPMSSTMTRRVQASSARASISPPGGWRPSCRLRSSVGLVFPVLAWSGFDTTGAQAMPETALDTLSSLYAWFPILPKAAAIAVMWNFPLGEDAQRSLRARIDSTARQQSASCTG